MKKQSNPPPPKGVRPNPPPAPPSPKTVKCSRPSCNRTVKYYGDTWDGKHYCSRECERDDAENYEQGE